MEAIDPRGVAKFDPRGMAGTIYVEDHQPLPHTKYQSCGSCGFRDEDFLFFFIYTCMLPWQPEFQFDLPKNNMQSFLLPIDAVCVI